MIATIVSPKTKDVEPVLSPAHRRERAVEHTAQGLPFCMGRAPVVPIPPLVAATIVSTKTKDVKSVLSPAHRRERAVEHTT